MPFALIRGRGWAEGASWQAAVVPEGVQEPIVPRAGPAPFESDWIAFESGLTPLECPAPGEARGAPWARVPLEVGRLGTTNHSDPEHGQEQQVSGAPFASS